MVNLAEHLQGREYSIDRGLAVVDLLLVLDMRLRTHTVADFGVHQSEQMEAVTLTSPISIHNHAAL